MPIGPRGFLLGAALLACACGGSSDDAGTNLQRAPVESRPAPPSFTDRAAEVGLTFTHFNGMSGELYYPEMFAPGVGLIDVDNDGDLDVYVTQGQTLGAAQPAELIYPPQGELRDRLFRNDLAVGADGAHALRFTDITAQSGIDLRTYGMGVAAGDFDNDGWTDIYRTGLDRGVLLRNNGNGTFSDVTEKSGTANRGSWGVSAAFVDIDRDGWLDLFVGNYLDYSIARDVDCMNVSGRRDYCPPHTYPAQRDRLYRNGGNGTFEDITARSLAGGAHGPALGVSTADFDGDGWMDIYVGNDGQPNQLWINNHDGTFRDMAFQSGAAVSGGGVPEASMGVDAGDFDNDGDEDLFITNWLSQMNTLYVNSGRAVFEDRRGPSRLGSPSLAKTGFGAAWFDADNDGLLDLLTVNGSVSTLEAQARAGDRFPFRMTKQLYRNVGEGRFEDVSARAGAAFGAAQVGRGAAFGDVDNDGDIDVLVGNDAGPLQLLINAAGAGAGFSPPDAAAVPAGSAPVGAGFSRPDAAVAPAGTHWIGLEILTRDGRDALGARVEIMTSDGRTIWRRVRSDGSYASANDPRVHAGLGGANGPVKVRVRWLGGNTGPWTDVPVDRWTTIRGVP